MKCAAGSFFPVACHLALVVALVLVLTGCGSDTTVFVCSGSAEFCNNFRDATTSSADSESVPVSALQIARKTPGLIQQGLAADQLDKASSETPAMVGAWLLTSSLGLLVDNGDNEAATRFFDETRFWLLQRDVSARADELLHAGLAVTVVAAGQGDPAVAEAAARLLSTVQVPGAAPDVLATAADAARVLAAAAPEAVGENCCSTILLAASAVALCDDLAAAGVVTDIRVGQACVVAQSWLASLE